MTHRDKIGDCTANCTIISLETFDKQEQPIIIDPLSDRIGIVLVWQDLIVSTKESSRKFNCCIKNSEHKQQILLNNINGTMTHGLCAVIG